MRLYESATSGLWTLDISAKERILGYNEENKAKSVVVLTAITGYTLYLDIQYFDGTKGELPLALSNSVATGSLLNSYLAVTGPANIQIRGVSTSDTTEVRKSNIVTVIVGDGINAVDELEEMTASEWDAYLAQIAEYRDAAVEAADEAKESVGKTVRVGYTNTAHASASKTVVLLDGATFSGNIGELLSVRFAGGHDADTLTLTVSGSTYGCYDTYLTSKYYTDLSNVDAHGYVTFLCIATGVLVRVDSAAVLDITQLNNEIESKPDKTDVFDATTSPDFTEQLAISTDTDGSVYGIQYGKLMSSQGVISDTTASLHCTGFIPAVKGDVIRMDGYKLCTAYSSPVMVYFNSSKERLFSRTLSGLSGETYLVTDCVFDSDENCTQFTVGGSSAVAYIRICNHNTGITGTNPILTVNEEITYSTVYRDKLKSNIKVDSSQVTNLTGRTAWDILPYERLNIAYSSIGRKPINTLEHFEDCCQNYGYNVLKADVRPTSDGELVLCHDPGFSFDSDGYITTYDSDNCTLIHDVTAETCTGYSFSSGEHPCLLGDYLDVCRTYGKVAFITIRDEYMDVVVPKVLSELKKHNMFHSAIINSLTLVSLKAWREVDTEVTCCYTLGRSANITSTELEQVDSLTNCIMGGFGLGGSTTEPDIEVDWDTVHDMGIRVICAIAYVSGAAEAAYAEGYDGCQIGIAWGAKS